MHVSFKGKNNNFNLLSMKQVRTYFVGATREEGPALRAKRPASGCAKPGAGLAVGPGFGSRPVEDRVGEVGAKGRSVLQ